MLLGDFRLVAGSGSSMLFRFRTVSCILIRFCGDIFCQRSEVGGSPILTSNWAVKAYSKRICNTGQQYICGEHLAV